MASVQTDLIEQGKSPTGALTDVSSITETDSINTWIRGKYPDMWGEKRRAIEEVYLSLQGVRPVGFYLIGFGLS
jgi:acyl-homoserine lactone acylase PvdQ